MIDGERCHQDAEVLDLSQPFIRDADGAQSSINVAQLAWWGVAGVLPGGDVSYRTVLGLHDAKIIEVNDSISGYVGPVTAVATTKHVYAFVVKTKE